MTARKDELSGLEGAFRNSHLPDRTARLVRLPKE